MYFVDAKIVKFTHSKMFNKNELTSEDFAKFRPTSLGLGESHAWWSCHDELSATESLACGTLHDQSTVSYAHSKELRDSCDVGPTLVVVLQTTFLPARTWIPSPSEEHNSYKYDQGQQWMFKSFESNTHFDNACPLPPPELGARGINRMREDGTKVVLYT